MEPPAYDKTPQASTEPPAYDQNPQTPITLDLPAQDSLKPEDLEYSYPHRLIILPSLDGSEKLEKIDLAANESLLILYSNSEGADFASVRGYEAYGEINRGELDPIKQQISIQQILNDKMQDPSHSATATAAIANLIVNYYRTSPASSDKGEILIPMSRIPVFMRNIQVDESPKSTQERCSMVWKWIKPDSPYLKRGCWKMTLSRAVLDGELKAGRNLTILARRVSLKKKRSLEGRITF